MSKSKTADASPSPAPASAPASESTPAEDTVDAAPAAKPVRLSEVRELLRQQANLRQTVETLMSRVQAQGELLDTVTQEMRSLMEEMRATMEVAQQAVAATDDQTDKLADVTAALIKVTQVQQAYLEQKQRESNNLL